MNILGIDTSTKTMSIALIQDEKILGELNFYSNMDHSEKLIDNIKFLMDSNHMTVSDLDLVGVAVGPGSFTGVRIGIATVKGIVEFMDIPVVGVSSLEILSRNFSSDRFVAVSVDAKRDRVYGGIYDYSNENPKIIKEGLFEIEDFKKELENYEDIVLVGDINERFSQLSNLRFGKEGNLINRASNICFISKEKFEKDQSISHLELEANYMTKSQAQMDYDNKNRWYKNKNWFRIWFR